MKTGTTRHLLDMTRANVRIVKKNERKRGIDQLRSAVNGMKGCTSIEQEFIEKMYDAGIRVAA